MEKRLIKKIIVPSWYSFLFLALLAVLLFFSCFLQKKVTASDTDTFMMLLLSDWLSQMPLSASSALAAAFVFFVSLLMMRINEVHSFIRSRTVLPSFLFMLYSVFSEFGICPNAGFVGAFFLIIAVGRYFDVFEHRNVMKSVFDTFFCLSVGSLFYADFFLLSFVFLIAMPMAGYFHVRQFFGAIVAFAVPYALILPVLYVFGKTDYFLFCTLDSLSLQFNAARNWDLARLAYSFYFFVALSVSFLYYFLNNLRDEVRVRRMLMFFYALTFAVCVLGLFRMKSFYSYYPVFLACLCLVCGYFFTLSRSKATRIMFGIFVSFPVLFSVWRLF